MLVENDKHRKYHKAGPKDLKPIKRSITGGMKNAIATFQVTRSTIDNEQMSVSIPVFEDDSREDLDLRVGMLLSVVQDRLEDAAEAWAKVEAQNQDKERAEKLAQKKQAREE